MKRREDLSTPRHQRRSLGTFYDPEAFGSFSEAIARFIGTARFLVWQSVLILMWLSWNYLVPKSMRFDNPSQGLVRLTLILSLQAAYAAPLILLAQNRQEARDRTESEQDRAVNSRTQADTEFLARELAAVRLGLADVANQADVADLTGAVERLTRQLGELQERWSDSVDPPAAAAAS